MSLTCTRPRPLALSQSWKRSTRRSADDSFSPGFFWNSCETVSLADDHLVDRRDAREAHGADDRGRSER